jgi:hypothetical protein
MQSKSGRYHFTFLRAFLLFIKIMENGVDYVNS